MKQKMCLKAGSEVFGKDALFFPIEAGEIVISHIGLTLVAFQVRNVVTRDNRIFPIQAGSLVVLKGVLKGVYSLAAERTLLYSHACRHPTVEEVAKYEQYKTV